MSLAKLFQLTPERSAAAFGALRAVIEAGGPVDAREADFLAACAETLEVPDAGPEAAAVTGARLAALFPDAEARRGLVHAMFVAACIDTQVSPGSVDAVHRYAAELGVRTRWLATLRHAARRQSAPIRRALYTHSPDSRRLFQRTWREDGVRGLWRVVRFLLGSSPVDPALARRYRQLGLLPEGTLGRTFWADMRQRGLDFPGEPGGLPEKILHHDLMHCITGYDTSPAGECQLSGFYAAFTPGEPFTFLVISLTTFHIGMKGVSPAFVLPTIGAFDVRHVLRAYERGARLGVDVMDSWDYWALMPLPLAEVRERLGIGALLS